MKRAGEGDADGQRKYDPYSFSSMPAWLRQYYAAKRKAGELKDRARADLQVRSRPLRAIKINKRLTTIATLSLAFGISVWTLSLD